MNEKRSLIVNWKNIMEVETYILKYSSSKKLLKISSEENSDNSFELNTEKLKFPMYVTTEAILREITDQIQQRFNEEEIFVLRCDQATKVAINSLAASNSVIFE